MRSVDIGLTLLTCTSAIAILLCILCSRLPFKQRTMHGDASTRRTPSKTGIYILPLIFAIIYICSVCLSVSERAQALYVMPALNFK